MKSRIAFYLSSLMLMSITLLILQTSDGRLWPFWLFATISMFISMMFYVVNRNKKKDPYQVDELQTLIKAHKDQEENENDN